MDRRYQCVALFASLVLCGQVTRATVLEREKLGNSLSIAGDIRNAHVFPEPLIYLGEEPSVLESQALDLAVRRFKEGRDTEDLRPFLEYLEAYPHSGWNASILVGIGSSYRHTGHFSRALEAYKTAWETSKSARNSVDRDAVSAAAFRGRIELLSRLGRMDEMKQLFSEVDGKSFQGAAGEWLTRSRDAYWRMEHEPELSFRCGPFALASINKALGRPEEPKIDRFLSSTLGTSLLQNYQWANEIGLPVKMAFRKPGSSVCVPSLVHWKAGHFAAVVQQRGDRYLLKDPTFGEEFWVRKSAFDDEASGYALILGVTKLPNDWRAVDAAEARGVYGKGNVGNPPAGGPYAPPGKPGDPNKPDTTCKGMPGYAFDWAFAALTLTDTPLSYTPPRGTGIAFTLHYFQRNSYQPQSFTFSNVGPKWSFEWVQYITDDPGNPGASVALINRYGGQATYTGYSSLTGAFTAQYYAHDQLVRNPDGSYTQSFPDGSKELFSKSNGATTYPRMVFRTKSIDPFGNSTTFSYDGMNRLTDVIDPLGQATHLYYELSSDPYKVTRVADPFGRVALLSYDGSGLLASITDTQGMVSTFTYYGTGSGSSSGYVPPKDFVTSMTTPYGKTSFKNWMNGSDYWTQVTDPMNQSEVIAYIVNCSAIPSLETYAPPGFTRDFHNYRNVFYWNKRAWALAPGDFTKGSLTHFLHSTTGGTLSSIPESIKEPLENRVWFQYGQGNSIVEGPSSKPIASYQIQDDGTWKIWQYEYHPVSFKTTKETDPLGRTTTYSYSTDGVDLLEVRNTTNGGNDLLAKYTYNGLHRPITAFGPNGLSTVLTYNGWGQVTSIKNTKNEATQFLYDLSGYLKEIDGAIPGTQTLFTYDAVGRLASLTGPDGYSLSYGYDNLDRLTTITHPDGSREQTIFDRLDVGASIDRMGRATVMTHDANRHLISVQDAQGRTTFMDWCACGQLESLTDPLGQTTYWIRDIQGRVTAKYLPDNSATRFFYDSVGRMYSRIDAMGQTTLYTFNLDNTLRQVDYQNAVKVTPSVAYNYDSIYPRVISMVDGTGTTSYTYSAITSTPTLGAGRLTQIQGPWANSTVTFGYDELDRLTSRAINGIPESRVFDGLGRVASLTNPLGTFIFNYDGLMNRLASIQYPNGQLANYSYFDVVGDKRLKSISNLRSDGSTISSFSYTYDKNGQIQTWIQQADAQSPKVYSYSYDAVGQLLGATLKDSGSGQILHSFLYGYDDSGNRTTEQVDGAVTTSSYNTLNQLVTQSFSPATAGLTAMSSPAGIIRKAKPSKASSTRGKKAAPVMSTSGH